MRTGDRAMRSDQAEELRRLVRDCAAKEGVEPCASPCWIVASSGKGGHATSVAVNLAAALAEEGVGLVRVDANPSGGDGALLYGLQERCTVADVLMGQRVVGEVLEAGGHGIGVIAGPWGQEGRVEGLPGERESGAKTSGDRLLKLDATELGLESACGFWITVEE